MSMPQETDSNRACQMSQVAGPRQCYQTTQKTSNKGVVQVQSQSREMKFNKGSTKERTRSPEDSNKLTPLWKTKLCVFAPHGLCSRGASCHYAHGEAELRKPPDFSKTSICPKLIRGEVCNDANCTYTHHAEELKELPGMLKTKICRFHAHLGRCVLGSRCRFAHGTEELATLVAVESETAASTPTRNKNSINTQNVTS